MTLNFVEMTIRFSRNTCTNLKKSYILMTYCIYCKLDFDARGPPLVFNFLRGMTLSHLPPPFNPQVTGGSSGIGKSIAMECYRQGAFITLVARDEVSRNKQNINALDSFALFFTQTAHLSSLLSFSLE